MIKQRATETFYKTAFLSVEFFERFYRDQIMLKCLQKLQICAVFDYNQFNTTTIILLF